MKKASNKFQKGTLSIIIFWGDFCRHSLKLEKVGPIFSSFNLFPSLPSIATDDRKQFPK